MNQGPPDLVGRIVLGRYRVVRAIGRGGMGVIYLARSEGAAGFVKPFVIKQAAAEIVAQGESMITQLAREARIMSNLRHPGIVSVIDFAEDAGSYLLVMDYVQGYNLGQWRKFVQHSGRPFSVEFALHVVERVLDALDYAHTLTRSDGVPLDIVHRDISPGNVLLDVEGRVKLADFGVARMSADHTRGSNAQTIKGKISYMAPELFSHSPPTPSTDVYACGVVLHELLVGRNEFKAENVSTTALRVMQHTPTAVRSIRSDVPRELDRVLLKALSKFPADRYASAREFGEALNALRTVPPDQTVRRLASNVKEEFNDLRMAELLGVEDPTTLERAWRDVTSATEAELLTIPRASPEQLTVHAEEPTGPPPLPSVPTVAAAPMAIANKSVRVPPWSSALGLGGLIVGACALIMVLRSQRAPQDGAERVIVVDSRVGVPTSASVESLPIAESAAPSAASSTPSLRAPARPPASVVGADGNAQALTQVLARRQDKIANCFATRAADVSGNPGLSVRFEVDANGRVLSAHVLPPALAVTALGQCIEAVARETEFGPQPRPLSFRIPMTAHRSL